MSNAYVATLFTCTNALSSPVIVGIELFGPAGGAALNDASASSLSVAPGGTVTFATQVTAAFVVDGVLGQAVSGGTGRVLTTTRVNASQGILCSAILHDSTASLPVAMTSLPVIRKTTQQGD